MTAREGQVSVLAYASQNGREPSPGKEQRSFSHFPLAVRWNAAIRTAEVKPVPRCQMCIRRGNVLQTVLRGPQPPSSLSRFPFVAVLEFAETDTCSLTCMVPTCLSETTTARSLLRKTQGRNRAHF